jgi:hypothetical protein
MYTYVRIDVIYVYIYIGEPDDAANSSASRKDWGLMDVHPGYGAGDLRYCMSGVSCLRLSCCINALNCCVQYLRLLAGFMRFT